MRLGVHNSVRGLCLAVALASGNAAANVELALPGIDYPLEPRQLSAGRLPAPIALKGSQGQRALALIGTERLSASWFRTNVSYLVERRAIVLVVQAPSEAHVAAIRREAQGLVVLPTRGGDAIASALGVSVFPVLIDPGAGVVRQ